MKRGTMTKHFEPLSSLEDLIRRDVYGNRPAMYIEAWRKGTRGVYKHTDAQLLAFIEHARARIERQRVSGTARAHVVAAMTATRKAQKQLHTILDELRSVRFGSPSQSITDIVDDATAMAFKFAEPDAVEEAKEVPPPPSIPVGSLVRNRFTDAEGRIVSARDAEGRYAVSYFAQPSDVKFEHHGEIVAVLAIPSRFPFVRLHDDRFAKRAPNLYSIGVEPMPPRSEMGPQHVRKFHVGDRVNVAGTGRGKVTHVYRGNVTPEPCVDVHIDGHHTPRSIPTRLISYLVPARGDTVRVFDSAAPHDPDLAIVVETRPDETQPHAIGSFEESPGKLIKIYYPDIVEIVEKVKS